MITSIIVTLFSIFPSWFAIVVLGLLAFVVISLAIRLVSAVLDALPFV